MSDYSDSDPFWVKSRAEFLAAKSASADPSACGTCRGNVAAGEPVEHDGCAQRATLLQAPDHPHYEILAGFSLEENEKLPPRFHVPVFDDLGQPNLWLCAVCQEEGTVVGWPCATAQKYGTQVFTPLHEAETAQKKQAAELERLRDDNVRLVDQQAKDDDEFAQAVAERDRYRLAWKSARERAQSSSETILRVVKDRESYQGWLKQEQAATELLRDRIAELEAAGHLTVAEVVAWLTKKAREFRAEGQREQADTASLLASKVARGAVRPNNLQMLPPDFFEPDHAYTHRDGSTFRCVAVTTHPDGGERVALGWHTDTADWTFVAVRNINHWNHEYDGVVPPETPAPQHYDKVPDPADGCHWCACGNRWPCKHAPAVTS
ncbi:hypothetical protein [Streptomyces mirabilis]|uniref:hypothetical protein n=1 Tax=Streptomyces mirabilis TaxID=68239 RepID=UPI00365B6253